MAWLSGPSSIEAIVRDQKQKFIRKTNRYFVTDHAFLRMKEEQRRPTFPLITYTYPVKKIPTIESMRALCKPTTQWNILSVLELKNIAKCKGIKGYYKMNKAELIQHVS